MTEAEQLGLKIAGQQSDPRVSYRVGIAIPYINGMSFNAGAAPHRTAWQAGRGW